MILLSGIRIPTSFRFRKILGNRLVPFRIKVKGPGQVTFHQLENVVVHFGIFTDAAQVIANNREIVFLRVNLFDPADVFDGTFLQAMATDGIHGVCGIDNQSPSFSRSTIRCRS